MKQNNIVRGISLLMVCMLVGCASYTPTLPRLGHTGPEDMDRTPKNVYSVDCDDVNDTYDHPKGHTYFRSGTSKGTPGVVFNHIFGCLVSGRVFPKKEDQRTLIVGLSSKSAK